MPLIINDERVDDGVIAQEIHAVRAQQREHPDQFSFESPDDLTEYARENVVCRVLLQQEAARRIEAVPQGEVEDAFSKLKSDYGGDEAFSNNYKAHEIDASQDAAIKQDLAANLKVQKLMDQLCEDVREPSDEEVRAYYDEHRDEFMHPKAIHASHIVKRPGDAADAQRVYEEMVDVRRKLLAGEDLARVAREHSDCSEDGGDLGFFSPGQMVEEFEAVAFSLDPGEVSPVFMTQFGYHVVKVHERREASPREFQEVRDDIRGQLLHDSKNDRIGEFVDGLKGRSTIVELPPEPPEGGEPAPAADALAEAEGE